MARKIAFDKEETLHKAMKLFWLKGFEATSMQDLVDELKINRFSIYNSFGDKKTLFLQSIVLYQNTVLATLIEPLLSDKPAKKRIDDYLLLVATQLQTKSGRLGCFIQNTSLSMISKDKVVSTLLSETFEGLRTALTDTINEAKEQNSFSNKEKTEVLVTYILCQIQGLILLTRALNEDMGLTGQMNILRAHVATW